MPKHLKPRKIRPVDWRMRGTVVAMSPLAALAVLFSMWAAAGVDPSAPVNEDGRPIVVTEVTSDIDHEQWWCDQVAPRVDSDLERHLIKLRQTERFLTQCR